MWKRYHWLTIYSNLIAVLVPTLSGCSTEPSTADTRTVKPLVLYNDSFVDSFLLTDDGWHRWRFTVDQFVVEGYREPLPSKLTRLLTATDSPVSISTFRIAGKWQLLDNGHTLRLTEIDADQAQGRPDVRLHVETTGSETLTIEGLRYRLATSLPLREMLPIRIYSANVDKVLRGDLLRVRESGKLRVVQLDGVICPEKGQPFGEAAIACCSELLGDASVVVKVFRVDDQGREVAQVWGPNYQYVNVKLLDDGFAWHDKRRSNDWVYSTFEDDARAERRGLWAQTDPIPPWDQATQD